MNQDNLSSYRFFEQFMTITLFVTLAFFLLYLIMAGCGIVAMKVVFAILALLLSGVSLFLLFVFLHISQGYVTVVLAHITFCTPYVVLSVLPKLTQMNPNIYEAALDLGATPFQALRKVLLPIFVIPFGMLMLVNALQSEKAPAPIAVTLLGISMFVSALQPAKAPKSIYVTPFGILMFVNALQSLKASNPILVTLLGILIFVNALHPLKTPSPISVTLSGNSMFARAVQRANRFRLRIVNFSEIFTLSRLEQLSKAPSPIIVTLFGIFIAPLNSLQSWNALSPNVSRLSGRVIEVRFPHNRKA